MLHCTVTWKWRNNYAMETPLALSLAPLFSEFLYTTLVSTLSERGTGSYSWSWWRDVRFALRQRVHILLEANLLVRVFFCYSAKVHWPYNG